MDQTTRTQSQFHYGSIEMIFVKAPYLREQWESQFHYGSIEMSDLVMDPTTRENLSQFHYGSIEIISGFNNSTE